MKYQNLTKRQIGILESLRAGADQKKKNMLESAINGTLSKENIESVCQTLNDEYLMRGINENYNPNEYGKELEALLDQINRPRLVNIEMQGERLAGE